MDNPDFNKELESLKTENANLKAALSAMEDEKKSAIERADGLVAEAEKKALETARKAEDEKAAAERYCREIRADTETVKRKIIDGAKVTAKTITDEAKSSAKSMTDEAKAVVEGYYNGKEAEGEARKERIIQGAKDDAEAIVKSAETNAKTVKNDAETAAQAIREAADKYAQTTRSSADTYAATTRSAADTYAEKTRSAADEAVKAGNESARAIKDEAYVEKENIIAAAREEGERIRAEARENSKDERAALEEAKLQLARDREEAEQLKAQAQRYGERLKLREKMLNEEVDRRVVEEYSAVICERDRAREAVKTVNKKNEALEKEKAERRNCLLNPNEARQFSEFLKMLEDRGTTLTDGYFQGLLSLEQEYSKLQKNYDALEKKYKKIKAENNELLVGQSNFSAQEDMLQAEQRHSDYYKKQTQNLMEELSKTQTVTREDMLAPVQLAPSCLNKNVRLYDGTDETEWLNNIREKAEKSGLYFTRRQLYAYHTAQKIREMSPVVVLAGTSGAGKSEMPKNYALYGGMHFLSIPVKPDWDSPASLFGYYNSIEKRFEATELLRAMWQMTHDPDYKNQMLMVLLDEMNLAHPEQYFADMLSKLETSRGYKNAEYDVLLGGGERPEHIEIGRNILWTGTMNEDETTKGLSDKVVDRSTLITFPRPDELRSKSGVSVRQEQEFILPKETWEGWLKPRRGADGDEFEKLITKYRRAVQDINSNMSEMGRNLGHRVWQGIEDYVRNYPDVVNARTDDLKHFADIAFADAVAFKVMPKLRGVEVRGRNEAHLDAIADVLKDNAEELLTDFGNARKMTTELFQWNSAVFMNEKQNGKSDGE